MDHMHLTMYISGVSINNQNYTDKTDLSVSFTSAVIVLLHEDILLLSSSTAVEQSTVEKLRECSATFFETLGMFSAASGKRHLESIRGKLDASCPLNHLRYYSIINLLLEPSVKIFEHQLISQTSRLYL